MNDPLAQPAPPPLFAPPPISPKPEDDERDLDDEGTICEGCFVNLDEYPCLCGPAGPRLGGVWTGDNAKVEKGGSR